MVQESHSCVVFLNDSRQGVLFAPLSGCDWCRMSMEGQSRRSGNIVPEGNNGVPATWVYAIAQDKDKAACIRHAP